LECDCAEDRINEFVAAQVIACQLTDPQVREPAETVYRERTAALEKTAPTADDSPQNRVDV